MVPVDAEHYCKGIFFFNPLNTQVERDRNRDNKGKHNTLVANFYYGGTQTIIVRTHNGPKKP